MLRKAVPASAPLRLDCDNTSNAPAVCSTDKPAAAAVEPVTLKDCAKSDISAAPYLDPAAKTLMTLFASVASSPNWLMVAAMAVAASVMSMPAACAKVMVSCCNVIKPCSPILSICICEASSVKAFTAPVAPSPDSSPVLRATRPISSSSLPAIPVMATKSAIACSYSMPDPVASWNTCTDLSSISAMFLNWILLIRSQTFPNPAAFCCTSSAFLPSSSNPFLTFARDEETRSFRLRSIWYFNLLSIYLQYYE